MSNIYTNTKTLDEFIDSYTDNQEEAEYLILGSRPLDLTNFKSLKGIFKCGVGTDNLPDTDIPICLPSERTRQIIYEEVAAFTCSLIFKCFYGKLGTVQPWSKIERNSITDKRLLIIGAGNIGTRVCDVFDSICDVRILDNNYGQIELTEKDIKEAVVDADIVSLHVPYNKSTHEFLDPSWLKPTAVLINTARGNLVNESKLYDFLLNNPEAQSAFDVFWTEPYDGKLLELDNFYASPHVASTCKQFFNSLYLDFLDFYESPSERV